MAKRNATQAAVDAFIAAVYPDAPALAAAAFDEETVLTEATRLIVEGRAQRERDAQKCREREKQHTDAGNQAGNIAWMQSCLDKAEEADACARAIERQES